MAPGVTVTPDQVSVGVLVSSISRDVIDAVVAAHGMGPKRSDGKLPTRGQIRHHMGLYLFPDDDYTEVATKVTGSLSRFGCWDASWTVPTSSGISQARKRGGCGGGGGRLHRGGAGSGHDEHLGCVAAAVAAAGDRRVRCGSAGHTGNAAEFGYSGSGDNRSALPKARVVALAECSTHAFLAAEVDAGEVGEKTLAGRLFPRLRPEELHEAGPKAQ